MLGLRKMMTVLLLADGKLRPVLIPRVARDLSSTWQATVIAVFFLQCRFVGAEAEGGVVFPCDGSYGYETTINM